MTSPVPVARIVGSRWMPSKAGLININACSTVKLSYSDTECRPRLTELTRYCWRRGLASGL